MQKSLNMKLTCFLQKSLPPFVVFRSQLGRINRFYPFDPPPEVETWKPELIPGNFSSLCRVCGCSGNKKCAGCKKVCYCSKIHQTSDWKERWLKKHFWDEKNCLACWYFGMQLLTPEITYLICFSIVFLFFLNCWL